MAKYPKSLDPRTLAKLQGVRLRARHIVEGYVAGLHRSPYKGFSIEFAEHREYVPGDDLRYMDWKAFGRTDKYYLKQYEDETNLICYLVLDISESMTYRGPDSALSKLEYAQLIVASLAWLVLQQQDAVGLATFDSQVRTRLPPASSPAQLRQVLDMLDDVDSRAKTRTGPIFHELAGRFTKRGVVIIMSDLFDDVPAMVAGLKHFRHRRHDVIVFHLLDAAELDFPFQRPTLFKGLEQLPAVHADPRSVRRSYLAEFGRYLESIQRECRSHDMDYQLVRTDQPVDAALTHCLARRMLKIN